MTIPPRIAVSGGIGAFLGTSAFLGGLYDFDRWGLLALATLVLGMVTVGASSALPRGLAAIAPGALVLLAGMQFASSSWAEDSQQALIAGHRTLSYAIALALLIVLFRERGAPRAFLIGVVSGVSAVAIYDLVLLLDAGGPGLFYRGRLDEPLGYVNGQAAVFAMAVWPLIATAEMASRRFVAAGALGLASLSLSLVVLTQSRGGLAALVAAALGVLVFIPGRLKRLILLALLVGGLALAWAKLSAPSAGFRAAGAVDEATSRGAAGTAVFVAFGVGATWLAILLSTPRIASRVSPSRRRAVARVAGIAMALIVLAAGASAAPSIAGGLDARVASFKALKPPETGSRLTSAGGNRYDYWRVAVNQFRRWPLGGVGAGNYDRTYFLERRTEEDVRQSHSIEFQALGETGIFGFIPLAGFLIMGIAALASRSRQAASTGFGQGLVVACCGIWLTWIVQTSVDWIHLLPGVTGIALGAVAALSRRLDRPSPGHGWLPIRPLLFAGLTLAVGSLGILLVADLHRRDAAQALARDPSKASTEAKASLKLSSDSPETYYALAAAQARLNQYLEARATLIEASRRKPHDFIPHALLGDLAVRRGDLTLARQDYVRALRLNPRSSALRRSVGATTLSQR